jgi:ankyrin repeat protein
MAMSVLIDLGASATDRDPEGNDALLCWARYVSAVDSQRLCRTLSLLLENGADINTRRNDGGSPIFASIATRYFFAGAEALLLHGANPNDVMQDGSGRTALMEACRRMLVRVVNLLLEYGGDPRATDAVGHTAAYYVSLVRNGPDKDEVMALLDSDYPAMSFILK